MRTVLLVLLCRTSCTSLPHQKGFTEVPSPMAERGGRFQSFSSATLHRSPSPDVPSGLVQASRKNMGRIGGSRARLYEVADARWRPWPAVQVTDITPAACPSAFGRMVISTSRSRRVTKRSSRFGREPFQFVILELRDVGMRNAEQLCRARLCHSAGRDQLVEPHRQLRTELSRRRPGRPARPPAASAAGSAGDGWPRHLATGEGRSGAAAWSRNGGCNVRLKSL